MRELEAEDVMQLFILPLLHSPEATSLEPRLLAAALAFPLVAGLLKVSSLPVTQTPAHSHPGGHVTSSRAQELLLAGLRQTAVVLTTRGPVRLPEAVSSTLYCSLELGGKLDVAADFPTFQVRSCVSEWCVGPATIV